MRLNTLPVVAAAMLVLAACNQPEPVVETLPEISGRTVTVKDEPLPEWDGKSWAIHEWGTFTAVQGSTGTVLDGLSHEERDLPEFVHDIRDFAGITGVSPKMETPVIYFYGPESRRVSVNVRFPRGLITQWYPAAHSVNLQGLTVNGAASGAAGREITDLKDGHIQWGYNDLLVLAPGQTKDKRADEKGGSTEAEFELPAVADDDPWRFCREVDANTLRACNLNAARQVEGGSAQRVINEYEKCLFYRGLGDFELPMKGEVSLENVADSEYEVRLKLTNLNPAEKLTAALLIYKQGDKSCWHFLGDIEREHNFDGQLGLEDAESNAESLIHELARHLTDSGLYGKEAYAMARTWQQGYFRDDGLRVLYILPAAFVDRELPLKVSGWDDLSGKDRKPTPIVRTFVARQELLSPSREAAMEATVKAAASGDAEAMKQLDAWGRFATPYLNRIREISGDKAVLAEVDRRLDALKLRR